MIHLEWCGGGGTAGREKIEIKKERGLNPLSKVLELISNLANNELAGALFRFDLLAHFFSCLFPAPPLPTSNWGSPPPSPHVGQTQVISKHWGRWYKREWQWGRDTGKDLIGQGSSYELGQRKVSHLPSRPSISNWWGIVSSLSLSLLFLSLSS